MADAHDVQDLSLAPAGADVLERVARSLPVLAVVGERMAAERSLDGIRVGACLPLTPETGVLLRTLAAAGAQVVVCGSDSRTTHDAVAAALVERDGIAVHARRDEDDSAFYRHVDAVADHRPQIVLDAGGDLLGLIHAARRETLDGVIAGVEESASGVERLRELEDDGVLGVPVIAVDEARSARLFDARFGTGWAVLDAVARLGGLDLAGRTVAIAGYGWTGRGLAVRAREGGAQVVIAEIDPLRALQAVADGFRVQGLQAAVAEADLVVTATGTSGVLRGEHAERLRDGAIVCNAGHAAVEIDVPALRQQAVEATRPRIGVEELVFADGRRVLLLADGHVVAHAAGGAPAPEVSDVRCSIQALAAEYAVRHADVLESRVYVVPHEIDVQVARLGLEALAVDHDGPA